MKQKQHVRKYSNGKKTLVNKGFSRMSGGYELNNKTGKIRPTAKYGEFGEIHKQSLIAMRPKNDTDESKAKKMLNDPAVTFDKFYNFLRDKEIGDWDDVNSEDIIKQYVAEMSKKGIHVSHILEAIEQSPSKYELYQIWLGNSMETPTPINSKKDLYEALGLQ